MRRGASFGNAIVGHMAARDGHQPQRAHQWPVSEPHRLVERGAPRRQGRARYARGPLRDVQHVLQPVRSLSENSLLQRLARLPGRPSSARTRRSCSIAQKRTAACTAGHSGSVADGTLDDPEDFIFQIRGSSSPTACDPGYQTSGWRQPEFVSGSPPPAYLGLAFPCSRWSTWQAAGAYGTGDKLPASLYPLEGDRFVPGRDDLHVGGDNWSADAAIRVIEADPGWRGMMVSLGAIDKMGHMWRPEDKVTGPPGSDQELSHLPFAAKNADPRVGRSWTRCAPRASSTRRW